MQRKLKTLINVTTQYVLYGKNFPLMTIHTRNGLTR